MIFKNTLMSSSLIESLHLLFLFYRKIEVKREDRERDRDNEQSRSPSSRLMDKVKGEPADMLPGATDHSTDSVEAYHERHHRVGQDCVLCLISHSETISLYP